MYLEFLFVVFYYIFTLKRRDVWFEIFVPLAIAAVFWFLHTQPDFSVTHAEVLKDSMAFLRILLGFTMASLALFLTKNPNLDDAKRYMTERYLNNKQLSLYDYIILSFSYLIILETTIHFVYFVYALLPIHVQPDYMLIIKSIYVSLFFHIILATIRAITEVWHTLQQR